MELDYVKEPFRSRIKKVVETLKSKKYKLISGNYFDFDSGKVEGCCSVGFLALNYYNTELERDPTRSDEIDTLLVEIVEHIAVPGVLIEYYQLRVERRNPGYLPVKTKDLSIEVREKLSRAFGKDNISNVSLVSLNDDGKLTKEELIDLLENHPRALIRETAFIDSVENLQSEDKPS